MSSRARRSKRLLHGARREHGKAVRQTGLALGLLLCGSAVWAQQPADSTRLQPVARFGEESSTAEQAAATTRRPGWQLRWRKSDQPIQGVPPSEPERVTHPSAAASDNARSRVLQAAFQAPNEQPNQLELPETLELPPDDDRDDPSNTDIFENPFDNIPRSPMTPQPSEQPAEPQPSPAPDEPNDVTPPSPSDLGPVPENPMRAEPEAIDDVPEYRANPFPQADETRDDEATDREDRRPVPRTTEGLIPPQRTAYSCDDFRERLNERTIDKVSLDISPPFRPDMIDEETFQRARERFEEKQEIREWRSTDGVVMAKGRLQDLAYEHVVIDAEYGGTEELPIDRISEADLAYVSENWGLPQECRVAQGAYEPRQWVSSQVTWKASALCHKPLYFEEVNLERYGHTAGPFAQPVISSAHFFFNIAVLPYKAGIHPPSECQYALGYYRPGSCAPWILPPVPLSLRGAVTQATVVASGVAWIP